MGDVLIMSSKERKRKIILEDVLKGRISLKDAAPKLGVGYRQAKRLKSKYLNKGDKGLVHGNRGMSGNRCYEAVFKQKVLSLYAQKYAGFGATFASEKLLELDGIEINAETLRLWLLSANLLTKQRKRKPYRKKRERREKFGELLQIDGSDHDWFSTGKRCCLLNIVDDATTTTLAQMDTGETCQVLLSTFWLWVKRYGVPKAVYVDLKSLYVSPVKRVDNDIEKTLNVFERTCNLLDVEVIKAYSPQAKGRVERNHGVYQDRFVKELALRNIKTIEEANEFLLTRYVDNINDKFAKKPTKMGDAHTRAGAYGDLNQVFCWEYVRVLRNDFTIRFDNKYYQLKKSQKARLTAKSKIVVRRHLDGSLSLWRKGIKLKFEEITAPIQQPKVKKERSNASLSTNSTANRHKTPWGQYNPNWLKKNKKTSRKVICQT